MQYMYMITMVSGFIIASNSAELHSDTATQLPVSHTVPVQHDTEEGQGNYAHNIMYVQ